MSSVRQTEHPWRHSDHITGRNGTAETRGEVSLCRGPNSGARQEMELLQGMRERAGGSAARQRVGAVQPLSEPQLQPLDVRCNWIQHLFDIQFHFIPALSSRAQRSPSSLVCS